MFPTHLSCASRLLFRLVSNPRVVSTLCYTSNQMGKNLPHDGRKQAIIRFCNVSSFTTELLEIHSEDPLLHVLFIPGNPGIISFYRDFVETVYELLGEKASVTAIGHISHTRKNSENGKLFSLQDQINHKTNFIKQELQNTKIPIILVGHSIGSHISLEVFKRFPQQVQCAVGLYPFLTLNKESLVQSMIGKIAMSRALCAAVSSVVALLGLFPYKVSRFLVRNFLGKSWSSTAVDAACNHLLQYHTMRNVLYMAMTEFKKMKYKRSQNGDYNQSDNSMTLARKFTGLCLYMGMKKESYERTTNIKSLLREVHRSPWTRDVTALSHLSGIGFVNLGKGLCHLLHLNWFLQSAPRNNTLLFVLQIAPMTALLDYKVFGRDRLGVH